MVVRRQMDYAAARGVPWGISESAYNVVDRHGTYQYKAFGVPGLGLKRGLGDELVVAPYATALAAMIDPARERRQPAPAGRGGRSRASTASSTRSTTPRASATDDDDAGDATTAQRRRSSAPTWPTTQGMTLVALANALLGDRMVEALSRRPARAGDRAAAAGARAAPRRRRSSRGRSTRCAWPRRPPPMPVRRYRSPHTRRSRTRSSCRTATTSRSVTNAGGGSQLLPRPAR